MKIRTMRYYISEALTSFWRNSFMSVASIATVALALFILGLFSLMAANLDYFAENLESQVQISVYLKDGLTTDQVMAVGKELKQLSDVKEITFTNKDQAMERLKERMKDQPGILDALDGKNPLPTSYEITFSNPDAVKKAPRKPRLFPASKARITRRKSLNSSSRSRPLFAGAALR